MEVSTNGRDYSSSGVRFELVSVSVQDVTPWLGPTLGGTVVTIAGSRLAHAESLRCTFGVSKWSTSVYSSSWSVAASVHGSEGVRCVSPRALPTGWSALELWSHGTSLRSGASFFVHVAMYVSAVDPPAGPVSGGTRVSVLGAGFREAATFRCRFEASGASAVSYTHLTLPTNREV